MEYSNIQTIRYMGNKNRLLNFVIPEIESVSNPGDIICDIMAGTHSIGYALKERNIIYANDIQFYSYIIGKSLLGNYQIPTIEMAHNDLDNFINLNIKNKDFVFFEKNYADTYFSKEQCCEIDNLRFAIEQQTDIDKKNFYLTVLMSVMCKAQSTTGHFAQYLPKDHKRVGILRKIEIYENFFKKIEDFDNFKVSNYDNKVYNLDYKDLFKLEEIKGVKCFYLDSPYTTDQYSRFYHLLETICKYDYPKLNHKAKYREDRAMSDFCYKKSVAKEFENIIKFASENNSSLIISYSNHGVIGVEEIEEIAKKYYQKVSVKYMNYEHSSQGKGVININEVIIKLEI